jgi:hypothetical protein
MNRFRSYDASENIYLHFSHFVDDLGRSSCILKYRRRAAVRDSNVLLTIRHNIIREGKIEEGASGG